jgi:hypothetical protein
MNGIITMAQPQPFFLVGYFGVPPKCRVVLIPTQIQFLQNRCAFSVLERLKSSFVLASCLHFPFPKWVLGKSQRRR